MLPPGVAGCGKLLRGHEGPIERVGTNCGDGWREETVDARLSGGLKAKACYSAIDLRDSFSWWNFWALQGFRIHYGYQGFQFFVSFPTSDFLG